MKEPFVVVDTADGNKVVGTASDEKGAKSIITSAELPPMKIKDKKTLKIMKSKKRQMIGQPFKEEYDHIKEMIQSGKSTRPEIGKDDREKYTGKETCNWLYNFPQDFFRCNATRICTRK